MRALIALVYLLPFWGSPLFGAEKIVLVAGGDPPLLSPFGLDFTPDGNIVLVEYSGHCITQIDAKGKRTRIAGSGIQGDVDGKALEAKFNNPHNLAVAKSGDIYVADTMNNKVRKIDGTTGAVTTIAGTGKRGFSGDGGPAKDATFNQLYHVALDPDGTALYMADLGNHRIRKLDLKTNTVNTVVGNGLTTVPKDGTKALESPLVDPRACAMDHKGRLYILERGGHALRVVEDGKIRTVVGIGKQGATGDGGPGLKATLSGPKFLWIDPEDNVLIADTDNNCIRKYLVKDGSIVRVAGTGKSGPAGLDGPPLAVELAHPHGVAVRANGEVVIVDSFNRRVLKIEK